MTCWGCGGTLARDEDGALYCPRATYCSGCHCQLHEHNYNPTAEGDYYGHEESEAVRCQWCREVFCVDCHLEHPPRCKEREEEDPWK